MIAQSIQLALAPVFVLVAIGHLLSTLSARLSRVADRAGDLQGRYAATTGEEHEKVVELIRATDQRIVLIGKSVMAMVLSGLCIGIDVAVLFLDELLRLDLQQAVGVIFLAAVALLMWGLVLFMRETQVATKALRIPLDLHDPRN